MMMQRSLGHAAIFFKLQNRSQTPTSERYFRCVKSCFTLTALERETEKKNRDVMKNSAMFSYQATERKRAYMNEALTGQKLRS